MSVPAIITRGLTKDYGSGRGIFDLDLGVASGEVLGFIGPNGARQYDDDPAVDGGRNQPGSRILLDAGICGVALLAVTVFRKGIAVGALGVVIGAGFFISLPAPMLRWPDWVLRLSPFDAFGTPYMDAPRPSGIALLAGCALIGAIGAALAAQRRSSLT